MRLKAQRIQTLAPEDEGEEAYEIGSFPVGPDDDVSPQKGANEMYPDASRDKGFASEHGFQHETGSRPSLTMPTSGEQTSTRQLEAVRSLPDFEPLHQWPQSEIQGVRVFHANTIRRKVQGIQFSRPEELPKDAVIEFKNTSGPFHMQNCFFPLDIIFVDKNMYITGISRMKPGDRLFYPPSGSTHAYEAHAGFVKDNDIMVGQKFF